MLINSPLPRAFLLLTLALPTLATAADPSASQPAEKLYSATRAFYILPPQQSPFETPAAPAAMDKEEMLHFMRRQQAAIQSDRIIESALKIDDIRKTSWYQENYSDPRGALKKSVTVTLDPDADLLKITMTCKVPAESAIIVNALSQEYRAWSEDNDAIAKSSQAKVMSDAVSKMQSLVDQQQEEMKAYRINNKVEAITPSDRAQRNLEVYQQQYIAAEQALNAAKANYYNIQDQVKSGILQLPPDAQKALMNTPLLQSMESKVVDLTMDRDVLLLSRHADDPAVKEIDTRLSSLDRQIKQLRDSLHGDALVMLQENAVTELKIAQAKFDDSARRKDVQEISIRDTDRRLVTYRQMEHELSELTRVLDDLQTRKRMLDLSHGVDLSRIRDFSGETVPPALDDFDLPKPPILQK